MSGISAESVLNKHWVS